MRRLGSANDHIILIGVDGMDPNVFKKLINEKTYRNVNKFISNAKFFNNSYTELARTQSSLTSILTGLTPIQHGQRVTLQDSANFRSSIENSLPIQKLKNKGYEVHLRLSDTNFVDFSGIGIVNKYAAPASHLFSLVAPFFLRNKILFSFFNNLIGKKIAPEVFSNASFQASYRVEGFAEEVLHDLKNLNTPTLYLAHMTKLHWPGNFPYPYYLYRNTQDVGQSRFAYDPQFFSVERATINKKEYNEFNKKLYENGHRYILENYLEPLFSWLEENQFLTNSTVVLYSDHNENFNLQDTPFVTIPAHGVWTYPQDNSYQTLLAVSNKRQFSHIDENKKISISQVLPILVDRSANYEHQYFETDWWPTAVYSKQPTEFNPDGDEYGIVDQRLELNEESARNYLLLKSRTIEFNQKYYSLILTRRGFIWLSNQADGDAQLREAWLQFKKIFAIDFANKLLPNLEINEKLSSNSYFVDFTPDKNQINENILSIYLKVQRAETYPGLQSEISSIINKYPNLSRSYEELLFNSYLHVCSEKWVKLYNKSKNLTIANISLEERIKRLRSKDNIRLVGECIRNKKISAASFRNFVLNNYASMSKNLQASFGITKAQIENLPDLLERKNRWPFWTDSFDVCAKPGVLSTDPQAVRTQNACRKNN